MKKIKTIVAVSTIAAILACSGCVSNYRPNTQKGWHLDEINKHTGRINRLDPVIYEVNQRVMPQRADQLGDTMSWSERMRARMGGMKGGE